MENRLEDGKLRPAFTPVNGILQRALLDTIRGLVIKLFGMRKRREHRHGRILFPVGVDIVDDNGRRGQGTYNAVGPVFQRGQSTRSLQADRLLFAFLHGKKQTEYIVFAGRSR